MRNVLGLPENVSWYGLVWYHCIRDLSTIHIRRDFTKLQGQLWETPGCIGLYPREKDDSCSLEILAWLWFAQLLEIRIIGNYFFQKWTLPWLLCFQFGTLWCGMAPLVPWFYFVAVYQVKAFGSKTQTTRNIMFQPCHFSDLLKAVIIKLILCFCLPVFWKMALSVKQSFICCYL